MKGETQWLLSHIYMNFSMNRNVTNTYTNCDGKVDNCNVLDAKITISNPGVTIIVFPV
jgi:hypothetical protein